MGLAAAIALQHFRFGMLPHKSFSSSSIDVTYVYIYIYVYVQEYLKKRKKVLFTARLQDEVDKEQRHKGLTA